ncbi:ABC transporter substrate-binding protein [Roseivirga echinicomitans]|nr:ABC transporter substrate-binding protein [Roseivirga echinicomitans]
MIIKTRCFIVLIFLSLVGHSSFAQDIKIMFDEAKALLDREQYALAMGRFNQISALGQDNDLVRYANFYHAISAYHSGDAAMAQGLFTQLEENYPDWSESANEINLWQAKIAFENGELENGLNHLETITDDNFKEEIDALKIEYLTKEKDRERLKSLLLHYPDPIIASNLLTSLLSENVMDRNFVLIDSLITTFNITPKVNIDGMNLSPKKEVYNIGLFFPFQYNGDSANLVRMMNDWPVRFLQGMKLGLEKLAEENININLMTFDTKTSATTTRAILADPKLKELDLIVGPAYPGPIGEVVRFSKENKINFINPLSSNGEILIDNPFAFLYYPSNESLAISAAEYTRKHLTKNKNVAIFYASEADKPRAQLYRKLIEKDSFNVVIEQMIRPNESVKIQQMLVEKIKVDKDSAERARMIAEMDSLLDAGVKKWEKYSKDDFLNEELGIMPDSLGHIFIASDIPSLSASVISGIDAREDTIYYVGSSRWLSSEQSISFQQLERVEAVFTGSNWIDYEKPSVKEFRERFLKKFSAVPKKEDRLGDAYIGYDIMVTYGRLLSQYGKYFQFGLKTKQMVPGELTDNFSYQLSNDNRYTPILRMVDSKVKQSNN